MCSCSKTCYYLFFLSTPLSPPASCPAAMVSTWQASPMAFCLWGNLTQSHHRQECCVSLSHPLPLLLFLRITKWLTFMTDTTVAKRAEIFILMKTGIFERKNAIVVAAFNETQSREDKVFVLVSIKSFLFSIASVILLTLLLALMKYVADVLIKK